MGKKFKKASQVIHDYSDSLIRERRKVFDYDKVSEQPFQDFLDLLFCARDEETDVGLTDSDIRDEVDTFLVRDSTQCELMTSLKATTPPRLEWHGRSTA